MSYSLTIYKNIFDNRTHKSMSFDSLEKFEKLLYDLAKQPGYKPKKGEFKEGSPLISPAAYVNGETRKNANVRDHEAPGGQWGNTQITTGDYKPGEWIDVSIEVNFRVSFTVLQGPP